MTASDPLAAEVQRRVRAELADLYEQVLAKSLELRARGDLTLAAAYRSVASDLYEAEQSVRSC